jgi:hypothetical protein
MGIGMLKLKSFLIGLIFLVLVLFAITLVIPRHITIAREANIAACPDSLQAFLEDLNQWPHWCTWKKGVVLLPTAPGEVPLHYQFHGLLPATGGFSLTRAGSDSTHLEWTVLVTLRWYPWEKMSGLAMDKILGASMDSSLRNLKALYGENP